MAAVAPASHRSVSGAGAATHRDRDTESPKPPSGNKIPLSVGARPVPSQNASGPLDFNLLQHKLAGLSTADHSPAPGAPFALGSPFRTNPSSPKLKPKSTRSKLSSEFTPSVAVRPRGFDSVLESDRNTIYPDDSVSMKGVPRHVPRAAAARAIPEIKEAAAKSKPSGASTKTKSTTTQVPVLQQVQHQLEQLQRLQEYTPPNVDGQETYPRRMTRLATPPQTDMPAPVPLTPARSAHTPQQRGLAPPAAAAHTEVNSIGITALDGPAYTDEATALSAWEHEYRLHTAAPETMSEMAHRVAEKNAQAMRDAEAEYRAAEREYAARERELELARAREREHVERNGQTSAELQSALAKLEYLQQTLRDVQATMIAERLERCRLERDLRAKENKSSNYKEQLASAADALRRLKKEGQQTEQDRQRIAFAFEEAKKRAFRYQEELKMREAREVGRDEGRREAWEEAERWMGPNPPFGLAAANQPPPAPAPAPLAPVNTGPAPRPTTMLGPQVTGPPPPPVLPMAFQPPGPPVPMPPGPMGPPMPGPMPQMLLQQPTGADPRTLSQQFVDAQHMFQPPPEHAGQPPAPSDYVLGEYLPGGEAQKYFDASPHTYVPKTQAQMDADAALAAEKEKDKQEAEKEAKRNLVASQSATPKVATPKAPSAAQSYLLSQAGKVRSQGPNASSGHSPASHAPSHAAGGVGHTASHHSKAPSTKAPSTHSRTHSRLPSAAPSEARGPIVLPRPGASAASSHKPSVQPTRVPLPPSTSPSVAPSRRHASADPTRVALPPSIVPSAVPSVAPSVAPRAASVAPLSRPPSTVNAAQHHVPPSVTSRNASTNAPTHSSAAPQRVSQPPSVAASYTFPPPLPPSTAPSVHAPSVASRGRPASVAPPSVASGHSAAPSKAPSKAPSVAPSKTPSPAPSAPRAPSVAPSVAPSKAPSVAHHRTASVYADHLLPTDQPPPPIVPAPAPAPSVRDSIVPNVEKPLPIPLGLGSRPGSVLSHSQLRNVSLTLEDPLPPPSTTSHKRSVSQPAHTHALHAHPHLQAGGNEGRYPVFPGSRPVQDDQDLGFIDPAQLVYRPKPPKEDKPEKADKAEKADREPARPPSAAARSRMAEALRDGSELDLQHIAEEPRASEPMQRSRPGSSTFSRPRAHTASETARWSLPDPSAPNGLGLTGLTLDADLMHRDGTMTPQVSTQDPAPPTPQAPVQFPLPQDTPSQSQVLTPREINVQPPSSNSKTPNGRSPHTPHTRHTVESLESAHGIPVGASRAPSVAPSVRSAHPPPTAAAHHASVGQRAPSAASPSIAPSHASPAVPKSSASVAKSQHTPQSQAPRSVTGTLPTQAARSAARPARSAAPSAAPTARSSGAQPAPAASVAGSASRSAYVETVSTSSEAKAPSARSRPPSVAGAQSMAASCASARSGAPTTARSYAPSIAPSERTRPPSVAPSRTASAHPPSAAPTAAGVPLPSSRGTSVPSVDTPPAPVVAVPPAAVMAVPPPASQSQSAAPSVRTVQPGVALSERTAKPVSVAGSIRTVQPASVAPSVRTVQPGSVAPSTRTLAPAAASAAPARSPAASAKSAPRTPSVAPSAAASTKHAPSAGATVVPVPPAAVVAVPPSAGSHASRAPTHAPASASVRSGTARPPSAAGRSPTVVPPTPVRSAAAPAPSARSRSDVPPPAASVRSAHPAPAPGRPSSIAKGPGALSSGTSSLHTRSSSDTYGSADYAAEPARLDTFHRAVGTMLPPSRGTSVVSGYTGWSGPPVYRTQPRAIVLPAPLAPQV